MAALLAIPAMQGAAAPAGAERARSNGTSSQEALQLAGRSFCPAGWPGWSHFQAAYVDASSGRVIDHGTDRRITVSEGQAYALFFALVAGDRAGFEQLLQWTENNLSAGNLRSKLPAWHWGRRDDGSWGVLDDNSATDADLWIAYTLAQAAERWNVLRYRELADSLADRILQEATATVPGLGLVLLPAPKGFGPHVQDGHTRVRLNPSYLPISLLRWWANRQGDPRWKDVLASSIRIVEQSANLGYAPDWVTVSARAGAASASEPPLRWSLDADANEARLGSYDAVRVYLWLGLMPPTDAARARLLARLPGMAHSLARLGEVPEKVDVRTGDVLASANPHLGWALLPYLKVLGRESEFRDLSARLQGLAPRFPAYYEDALRLFASGHLSALYRFDASGSLELVSNSCSNVSRSPSPRLP